MPYSGEEVKLHWANNDQYYIKTGENFKDYTFNIEDNFNITFILTDAEIERDNNKSDDKKVYVLAEPSEEYEKPIYILENEDKTQAELFIRLSYRKKHGKDDTQSKSNIIIIDNIKQLENDNEISSNIKSKIGNLFKIRNEQNKDKDIYTKSHIGYHLNKFIAKNSFDFFIHKDLKKFLMQELDFYIKNEVIYLQDLYGSMDNIKTLDMYVKKASVIQNIGSEIITFLAQLEDFQKALYLKKKFVTETNYCITLDKIDEKYYDEIIANQAQIEEWKKLFAIDEIEGDLHTKEYSEPLIKEFLQENKYLVLDTAFFSEEFKEKIIADIENLDENIDGLLIHGDNFQALNLMQEKYKEQVQCVYIDPPYNTKNRDFNYKDNYKHSSWLAMMYDRLEKMKQLMNDEAVFFSSIDDNELDVFKQILHKFLMEENFIAQFPWRKRTAKSDVPFGVSQDYEWILSYAVSKIFKAGIFGKPRKYYETPDFPNRPWRIHELTTHRTSTERPKSFFTIINPKTNEEYPANPNATWRITEETFPKYMSENRIVFPGDYSFLNISKPVMRYWKDDDMKKAGDDFGKVAVSTKLPDTVGMSKDGTQEMVKLFNDKRFSFPKATSLIQFLVNISVNNTDTILDFFAGSGTTGHAVINLNREDKENGKRKYILVEMGEYFDTVTKPRIEKVIYSKDWKDGKPVSREGSSHIFKYIRLESYEDTLNNVEFSKPLVVDDFLQNEYLTKYKIQKEAENSKIYLPAEVFYNPFEFQLKITRKNESRVQKIDLIETFNFLIGLQVNNIYTKKYNAEFKTTDTGRLQADIKPDNNGQYIFKIVEGSTLKREKVLVIWRNIVGNINNNNDLNKNNAVLESVIFKNQIKPTDSEYDIIYINCTNSLQNFAKEGSYKVALIEEVMKDKMFNGI